MAHCVECGSSVTLPCHVLEYKYVLCMLHCDYMEHAVLLTIILYVCKMYYILYTVL